MVAPGSIGRRVRHTQGRVIQRGRERVDGAAGRIIRHGHRGPGHHAPGPGRAQRGHGHGRREDEKRAVGRRAPAVGQRVGGTAAQHHRRTSGDGRGERRGRRIGRNIEGQRRTAAPGPDHARGKPRDRDHPGRDSELPAEPGKQRIERDIVGQRDQIPRTVGAAGVARAGRGRRQRAADDRPGQSEQHRQREQHRQDQRNGATPPAASQHERERGQDRDETQR